MILIPCIIDFCYSTQKIVLPCILIANLIVLFFFFFSIITLYIKNVKQIKNIINSATITIYVVEGKLNVKKKEKRKSELN